MASDTFKLEAVLEAVLSKLRALAETEQTFGQPITVGGTTIVPFMSLQFGIGGGGGQMGELKPASTSIWGGAGGGVRIEPMGFLVICGERVELISLDQKPGQWGKLADSVLPLLQQWIDSRSPEELETGEQASR